MNPLQDTSISSSANMWNGFSPSKLLDVEERELENWLQQILSNYCQKTTNGAAEAMDLYENRHSSRWRVLCRNIFDKLANSFSILGPRVPKAENLGFRLMKIKPESVEPCDSFGDDSVGCIRVEVEYQMAADPELTRIDHILIQAAKFTHCIHGNDPVFGFFQMARQEIESYKILFPALVREAARSGRIHRTFPGTFPIPTCYYGKYNSQLMHVIPAICGHGQEYFYETHAVIIFQDMEKNRFKLMTEYLSFEKGKAILQGIAKIHASSWSLSKRSDMSELRKAFPFIKTLQDLTAYYAVIIKNGLKNLIELLSGPVGHKSVDGKANVNSLILQLEAWVGNISGILKLLMGSSSLPRVLAHNDLRVGSIYFRESEFDNLGLDPNAIEFIIANWKLSCWAPPSHDIAFFLLTSFTNEARKAYAAELLRAYFDTFTDWVSESGYPIPFGLCDLLKEYKRSLFLSFLIISANISLVNPVDTITLSNLLITIQDILDDNL